MEKYYGAESYFNGDVTFYKDVTINGQLKYDELSLVRLTVTDKITAGIVTAGIVTATTYYGDGSNFTGIGSLTAAVEQTDYSCTNPITTLGNTIKISEDSNAYGTRYVENYFPLSSDGCDGDLWYYTAGSGTSPFFVGWTYYASNPVSLRGNSTTISSLPNNLKAIRIIFENVGWNSNANNDLLVKLDSSVLWNFKTVATDPSVNTSWTGANDGFGIYRPGGSTNRYYFGTMELYRSEGSTSQSSFWVGKHQVVATDFGTTVTSVAYRSGAGVAYPNITGYGQPTSIVFKASSTANFSGNSKVHLYYITD